MIQAEAQILLYLADHEGNLEIYLSKPFEYENATVPEGTGRGSPDPDHPPKQRMAHINLLGQQGATLSGILQHQGWSLNPR